MTLRPAGFGGAIWLREPARATSNHCGRRHRDRRRSSRRDAVRGKRGAGGSYRVVAGVLREDIDAGAVGGSVARVGDAHHDLGPRTTSRRCPQKKSPMCARCARLRDRRSPRAGDHTSGRSGAGHRRRHDFAGKATAISPLASATASRSPTDGPMGNAGSAGGTAHGDRARPPSMT